MSRYSGRDLVYVCRDLDARVEALEKASRKEPSMATDRDYDRYATTVEAATKQAAENERLRQAVLKECR